MNPISVLPNPAIDSTGIVSQQFVKNNLTTFHQACHWVKNLPYGSNSSNQEHKIYYLEYLEKYFIVEPRFKGLGAIKVLELIEKCKQQLKYQCLLMHQTV
ncbi:MAG: hypothetical protein AB4372_05910 [Xenococcus sp. (in: cyanobacteria)]